MQAKYFLINEYEINEILDYLRCQPMKDVEKHVLRILNLKPANVLPTKESEAQ